jgi:hypothetical protein
MPCSGSVTSQKICVSTTPSAVTCKFMCSSMTWYLNYWALNLKFEALSYCGWGLWNRQERTGRRLSVRNVTTRTQADSNIGLKVTALCDVMLCSLVDTTWDSRRPEVTLVNKLSQRSAFWIRLWDTSDVTSRTVATTCRTLCVLHVLPAVQVALYLAVLLCHYSPRCLAPYRWG